MARSFKSRNKLVVFI